MNFREELKNAKGVRPVPITMNNGKTLDFALLSRKERQMMLKQLKKTCPSAVEKIKLARKIKIYEEPIKENVYFCDNCNKTHVAHDLDEGVTPMFITCHNCAHPEARSLGYQIPDSYKNKRPDIVFRYPTREEFWDAPEALKQHLEGGGLWMEIIK